MIVRFYDLEFDGPNILKEAENNCLFKVLVELSDTECFETNFKNKCF